MLATISYLTIVVTVLITGWYAYIFVRDPDAAMEKATHRLDLLPQVMAGRYVVMFLLTVGVLILADIRVAAYYFAVCTYLGLHDGWVYWRRGLPHFKHTITGLLALGALGIALAALTLSGEAV